MASILTDEYHFRVFVDEVAKKILQFPSESLNTLLRDTHPSATDRELYNSYLLKGLRLFGQDTEANREIVRFIILFAHVDDFDSAEEMVTYVHANNSGATTLHKVGQWYRSIGNGELIEPDRQQFAATHKRRKTNHEAQEEAEEIKRREDEEQREQYRVRKEIHGVHREILRVFHMLVDDHATMTKKFRQDAYHYISSMITGLKRRIASLGENQPYEIMTGTPEEIQYQIQLLQRYLQIQEESPEEHVSEEVKAYPRQRIRQLVQHLSSTESERARASAVMAQQSEHEQKGPSCSTPDFVSLEDLSPRQEGVITIATEPHQKSPQCYIRTLLLTYFVEQSPLFEWANRAFTTFDPGYPIVQSLFLLPFGNFLISNDSVNALMDENVTAYYLEEIPGIHYVGAENHTSSAIWDRTDLKIYHVKPEPLQIEEPEEESEEDDEVNEEEVENAFAAYADELAARGLGHVLSPQRRPEAKEPEVKEPEVKEREVKEPENAEDIELIYPPVIDSTEGSYALRMRNVQEYVEVSCSYIPPSQITDRDFPPVNSLVERRYRTELSNRLFHYYPYLVYLRPEKQEEIQEDIRELFLLSAMLDLPHLYEEEKKFIVKHVRDSTTMISLEMGEDLRTGLTQKPFLDKFGMCYIPILFQLD